MSTTSSSRASALVFGAVLLAACQAPELAPDHPAIDRRPVAVADVPGRTVEHLPVELRSVEVGPLDRATAPWTREEALEKARDPLLIEVVTARPLELKPDSSYPLIVWNGRKLPRTRIVPGTSDRLQAYLIARSEVQERNQVQVFWEGREAETITRKPLFVLPDQVRR